MTARYHAHNPRTVGTTHVAGGLVQMYTADWRPADHGWPEWMARPFWAVWRHPNRRAKQIAQTDTLAELREQIEVFRDSVEASS